MFSSVLWWLDDIFLMHLPSFDKFNYQIYSLISLKIQYPTKILMWICKTHRHKYIWSDLVIFNVIEILATPDFISTNFSCVDIPNLCSCMHGALPFHESYKAGMKGLFLVLMHLEKSSCHSSLSSLQVPWTELAHANSCLVQFSGGQAFIFQKRPARLSPSQQITKHLFFQKPPLHV